MYLEKFLTHFSIELTRQQKDAVLEKVSGFEVATRTTWEMERWTWLYYMIFRGEGVLNNEHDVYKYLIEHGFTKTRNRSKKKEAKRYYLKMNRDPIIPVEKAGMHGKPHVGFYKFLILPLLHGDCKTKYSIGNDLGELGISSETANENLSFWEDAGVVMKAPSMDDQKVNEYHLIDGAYCFMSFLLLTMPLVMLPCKYYVKCGGRERCKMMDEARETIGAVFMPVKRVRCWMPGGDGHD